MFYTVGWTASYYIRGGDNRGGMNVFTSLEGAKAFYEGKGNKEEYSAPRASSELSGLLSASSWRYYSYYGTGQYGYEEEEKFQSEATPLEELLLGMGVLPISCRDCHGQNSDCPTCKGVGMEFCCPVCQGQGRHCGLDLLHKHGPDREAESAYRIHHGRYATCDGCQGTGFMPIGLFKAWLVNAKLIHKRISLGDRLWVVDWEERCEWDPQIGGDAFWTEMVAEKATRNNVGHGMIIDAPSKERAKKIFQAIPESDTEKRFQVFLGLYLRYLI